MKFTLKADHKAALEKLVKSGMTPVVTAQRAKILLFKEQGKSSSNIADELGTIQVPVKVRLFLEIGNLCK